MMEEHVHARTREAGLHARSGRARHRVGGRRSASRAHPNGAQTRPLPRLMPCTSFIAVPTGRRLAQVGARARAPITRGCSKQRLAPLCV